MANEAKIIISAKNATSRAVRSVKDSFKALGRAAVQAGRTISKALAAATFGAAGFSIKGAIGFSKGLAKIRTIANYTAAEMKVLKKSIIDLSNETGQARDVLEDGLYQTLSSGVPKDNAFEFLTVSAKAAVAGITDVETAVTGLTDIMNAYGASAADVERVSDLLFTVVRDGKIDFAQLSANISKLAPTARSAGMSMETMAAAVAAAVRVEKPERAMTALRAAIFETTKQGKNLIDVARDLAGASLGDVLGAGFSQESAQGILLLSQNIQVLETELANMQNSAGATVTAFGVMKEAASSSLEQLQRAVSNLGVELVDGALPALQDEIDDLLKKIEQWRNDGTLERWSAQTVEAITAIVNAIRYVVELIAAHKKEIVALGFSYVAVEIVVAATKAVKGLKIAIKALTSAELHNWAAKNLKLINAMPATLAKIGAYGAVAFGGWKMGTAIGELTGIHELLSDIGESLAMTNKGVIERDGALYAEDDDGSRAKRVAAMRDRARKADAAKAKEQAKKTAQEIERQQSTATPGTPTIDDDLIKAAKKVAEKTKKLEAEREGILQDINQAYDDRMFDAAIDSLDDQIDKLHEAEQAGRETARALAEEYEKAAGKAKDAWGAVIAGDIPGRMQDRDEREQQRADKQRQRDEKRAERDLEKAKQRQGLGLALSRRQRALLKADELRQEAAWKKDIAEGQKLAAEADKQQRLDVEAKKAAMLAKKQFDDAQAIRAAQDAKLAQIRDRLVALRQQGAVVNVDVGAVVQAINRQASTAKATASNMITRQNSMVSIASLSANELQQIKSLLKQNLQAAGYG